MKKKILEAEKIINVPTAQTNIDKTHHSINGKTIWNLLEKQRGMKEIKLRYPSFSSKQILFDNNSWINHHIKDETALEQVSKPFNEFMSNVTNKISMKWKDKKSLFLSKTKLPESSFLPDNATLQKNHEYLSKEEIIFSSNEQLLKSTNFQIFILFIVSAFILSIFIVNINRFFSNTITNLDRSKISSYECGFQPFEQLDKSQLFIFYRLSVFFIIFEAELIVLYPWAVNMINQNMFEGSLYYFYSPIFFIFIIIYGFYLEIKNKALDF